MESLYRLIYYSRNCIAGSPAEVDHVVRDLLEVARRKNKAAAITGALMFNHACFAQVLEGPQAAVNATYSRIRADKRHRDIEFLVFEEVTRRSFPEWSMAYVGAPGVERENYRDIAETTGFDPRNMLADALLHTLRGLVADTDALSHPIS